MTKTIRFFKRLITASLLVVLVLINPIKVIALEITLSGNGADSTNTATVDISSETTVNQNNSADIQNDIAISGNTGGNTIEAVYGGESSITTGNVVLQTAIANSGNISAVSAGCCANNSPSDITIVGNNSNSDNTVTYSSYSNSDTNITQTANVTNGVNGSANTGKNRISNTSGIAVIDTGYIKVKGKIKNGPFNGVFSSNANLPFGVSAEIKDNNTNTTNSITIKKESSQDNNIINQLDLTNSVNYDLNTGDNLLDNILGPSYIFTGDIAIDFEIENGPLNFSYANIGCCDDAVIDDPVDPGVGGDDPVDPVDPEIIKTSPNSNGDDDPPSVGGMVAAMVLGSTGEAKDNLMLVIFSLGAVLTGLGVRRFSYSASE